MWLIIAIPIVFLLTLIISYLYWCIALKKHLPMPMRGFLVHDVVPKPSFFSASEMSIEKFTLFLDEAEAAGLRFVSPERCFASESPDDALLTFDDGFESFYEHVYPILKERSIPALVFTVDNYAGMNADWDYRNAERKHLSQKLIDEMTAGGLIFFGSHSATHPDLTRISPEKLEEEVAAGDLDLFRCFSYPFGKFNPHVVGSVKETGFYRAFCSLNGDPKQWNKRFAIPRFPLNRFDNRFTLRTKIRSGRLVWLEVIKSRVIGMFAPLTHDWKGR